MKLKNDMPKRDFSNGLTSKNLDQKENLRSCIQRANYARIKSLLESIENLEGLELQLVVGASALYIDLVLLLI